MMTIKEENLYPEEETFDEYIIHGAERSLEEIIIAKLDAIEKNQRENFDWTVSKLNAIEKTQKENFDWTISKLNAIQKTHEQNLSVSIKNHIISKQAIKQENMKSIFPIETVEDLNHFEANIDENLDEYTTIIENILSKGNLQKNFSRLFGDSVICACNYDGLRDKIPFKSFKKTNEIIFDYIRKNRQGYTIKDYAQEVKRAFHLRKNRIYKTKSLAKKLFSN